jgi:hypothetical protein
LAPTVGIVATGFCYPGGILQAFIDKISKFFIDKISKFFIDKIRKLFIDKISKFFGCRQQQTVRSHLAESTFIYGGQIAMEMVYPHQERSNFSIDNIIRRLFSLRRGQGVRLPEDSGCLRYSLVHHILEKFESD